MSNEIKDIDVKNYTYNLFNGIINIKTFGTNNIKINEKSYKNNFFYYIGYVSIKISKYLRINLVNALYLTFSKGNEYFDEINGNKYLTLVPTNESKENIKQYEELWSKIRDLIKLINKNWDNYDKKHMKIKFNSDHELPLNKMIQIPSMKIVFRATFHKNNKYYSQFFLDECMNVWIT